MKIRTSTILCLLFLVVLSPNVFALNLGTGGFGTTGFVVQDLGTTEEAQAGVYYSNGRLVLVGYTSNGSNNDFTAIRLFPDGTIDTSFGSSGQARTNLNGLDDKAYAVTLDTFGRVLVAGETTTAGAGVNFGLVRYDTNGILDTKFGSAGIVNSDFGGNLTDIGKAVQINNQAQIIVAGYRDVGSSDVDFALARYMSNGALDTKFASGGRATTPVVASQNDYIRALYFRSNNGFNVVGYTNDGTLSDFAVSRYASNGLLDSTFGSAGNTIVDFAAKEDTAFDLVFDGNNRLLVLGNTHNGSNFDFAFARYNSNGTLDSKFASAGKAIRQCSATQNDIGRGLQIFGSNDIMAAGTVSNGSNLDLCVMRVASNGVLDTKYDTDGLYSADLSGLDDPINGLAWDGAYYFTAIGGYNTASGEDFTAARIAGKTGLAKSGDANTFFWGSTGTGVGGLFFDPSAGGEDELFDLDFQTDFSIVMVGRTDEYMTSYARVVAHGTLDTKFGSAGMNLYSVPPWMDRFFAVKVNENNRAIGGGQNVVNGLSVRLETNGLFDTKYHNGIIALDPPNVITSVLYEPGGNFSYYYGIYSSDQIALTRHNSDGSWDTNYASSGLGTIGLGVKNIRGQLLDSKFASGGKTMICGPHTCGGFVARISTTGVNDTTFGSNGLKYISAQSVNNCSDDRASKVVLVGKNNGHCAVWRINSNGLADTTFNTTGAAEVDWASGTDKCGGQAQQNGKIVVAGISSDLNVFCYSRLLSDGSLDAPFHSNPASDDDLFGGSAQDFNRIILNDRDTLFIVGKTSGASDNWAIQSVLP